MAIKTELSKTQFLLGDTITITCSTTNSEISTFEIGLPVISGNSYSGTTLKSSIQIDQPTEWNTNQDLTLKALISLIPSGDSENAVTLVCRGLDAVGEIIESISFTVYLRIPDTDQFRPSATLIVTDTNSKTSMIQGGVQGLSVFQVKLSQLEGKYGAWIQQVEIWIDQRKVRTITENFTDPYTLPAIYQTGKQQISVLIQDNHQRQTTLTYEVNPVSYQAPILNQCHGFRTIDGVNEDIDGKTIALEYRFVLTQMSVAGTSYNQSAKIYVYSVEPDPNDLSTTKDILKVSKSISPSSITGGSAVYSGKLTLGSNFLQNTDYNIKFKIEDSFSSIERTITVPKTFVLSSWRRDATGVAFGKKATEQYQMDVGLLANHRIGTVQRECYQQSLQVYRSSGSGYWMKVCTWPVTNSNNGYVFNMKASVRAANFTTTIHASAGVFASQFDGYFWMDGSYNQSIQMRIVRENAGYRSFYLYIPYSSYIALINLECSSPMELVSTVKQTGNKKDLRYSFQSSVSSGYNFKDMTVDFKGYPVGSVYITLDSDDPGDLFGGTWQRCSQGRSLVGSGTASDWQSHTVSYRAGEAGGHAYVPLAEDNLPYMTAAMERYGNLYGLERDSSAFAGRIVIERPRDDNMDHANVAYYEVDVRDPFYVANMWVRTA